MTSILFRILTICHCRFKCHDPQNKNVFRHFFIFLFFYFYFFFYFLFFSFLKSLLNFKHFEKKFIVIANGFPKLQIVKDLIRSLSKKRRLRTSLDSQHVKASQTLAKSPWEHFYHILHLFRGNWFGKCFP